MEQKSLSKELNKTNLYLKKGLKENTEIFLRKTCCLIKNKSKKNPLIFIKKTVRIIKPFCEIKTIKIKGSLIKVPIETSKKRQQLLVSKFILLSLNYKNSFLFIYDKLSNELIKLNALTGNSIKICDNFKKNVETNKIFMQYHF
jgi:ribosomal protein S7